MSRGIPWSLGGTAASRVITLLTTVLLARLLVPADFGLFALALLAVTVINMLSDAGLTGVLVVRQDFDRHSQGTVFTLLLALGALFAAILIAIAPLVAMLFREPRLEDVLRPLAAISLLSGIYWFYGMVLERELLFRTRFMVLMGRTISYAGVAIAIAALGGGVWSLVGGHLASALFASLVLPWVSPYRVLPRFDPATALIALREGRGFLLQAVVTTVQNNLDSAVVGRVLGAGPLGIYSMAYRLGEVPYASIAEPVARVSFPAFARMRHIGEDVVPGFLRQLQLTALLTWPLGILLSAAADPFTRVVLGDKWLALIGPLAVFGIWAAVRPLETAVGWFLNAMGQAGRSGRISTLLLVPLAPALIAGAHVGGPTGVAWVLLAHLTLNVLLLQRVAHRLLGVGARRQWDALRVLVTPAVVCWVITRLTAEATQGMPPAITLAVAVAAGMASYVVLVWMFAPLLLRRTWQEVGQVFSRLRRTA